MQQRRHLGHAAPECLDHHRDGRQQLGRQAPRLHARDRVPCLTSYAQVSCGGSLLCTVIISEAVGWQLNTVRQSGRANPTQLSGAAIQSGHVQSAKQGNTSMTSRTGLNDEAESDVSPR